MKKRLNFKTNKSSKMEESIQHNSVNPFNPNGLAYPISRTSPFPFLGFLGGIFHFYSNFNSKFCKQTVETLIRCRRSGSALFAYVPQKGC